MVNQPDLPLIYCKSQPKLAYPQLSNLIESKMAIQVQLCHETLSLETQVLIQGLFVTENVLTVSKSSLESNILPE